MSWIRIALLALLLLVESPLLAQDKPPQDAPTAQAKAEKPQRIAIGDSAWSSGRVVQHILAEILQRHFNVEAEFVAARLDDLAGETELQVDISTEVWMPSLEELWRRQIAPGSSERLVTNAAPYRAREGLYVPWFVQKLYGVRHVDDLRDPEIARLFDLDGDGLGELWPGAPDWRAAKIHEIKASSYGFASQYEMLDMEVLPFLEHFAAAYEAQQPILFYGWEPSEFNASFDIRRLEEPPFDGYAEPRWPGDSQHTPGGCWYFVDPAEDPDWLKKSSIRCAYPDSEIWLAFDADLRRSHPEVAHFLENLVIPRDLLDSWIRLVYDFEIPPEEMAKIWVSENEQIVGDWVSGSP